jgi:hypothetical protein
MIGAGAAPSGDDDGAASPVAHRDHHLAAIKSDASVTGEKSLGISLCAAAERNENQQERNRRS